MSTLPSVLALTTIADGASIVAADHRNNYSAVQTEANALLGILDDGATGQFFTGNGTTVSWAYPPGYEYNYTAFTSDVSVTATTEATANTVVTMSAAVTFDGSTAAWIEFGCTDVIPPNTGTITFALYDGAASVGLMAFVTTPSGTPSLSAPARVRLTPSAAAKTYSIRAYVSAGTGTVKAGAGGIGNRMPGFIRVAKA